MPPQTHSRAKPTQNRVNLTQSRVAITRVNRSFLSPELLSRRPCFHHSLFTIHPPPRHASTPFTNSPATSVRR